MKLKHKIILFNMDSDLKSSKREFIKLIENAPIIVLIPDEVRTAKDGETYLNYLNDIRVCTIEETFGEQIIMKRMEFQNADDLINALPEITENINNNPNINKNGDHQEV